MAIKREAAKKRPRPEAGVDWHRVEHALRGLCCGRCTVIDTLPFTVTSPGRYGLAADLSFAASTGAAVTIESDFVDFNLCGHALLGTAGPLTRASGIQVVSRKAVRVHNGVLGGFNYGAVFFQGECSFGLVEDIRVAGGTYEGIRMEGTLHVARRNQVCGIDNNPDALTGGNRTTVGIFLAGSGNRVLNNDVSEIGIQGGQGECIMMNASDRSIVEGNRIVNSVQTGDGIQLGHSRGCIVSANRVINTTLGIGAYNPDAFVYRDNFTLGCQCPYANGIDAGNNR